MMIMPPKNIDPRSKLKPRPQVEPINPVSVREILYKITIITRIVIKTFLNVWLIDNHYSTYYFNRFKFYKT
jgi:hypothetical protein